MSNSQWDFNELQKTETITIKAGYAASFQKIAGGPHYSIRARISTGLGIGNETRDVILTPTSDPNQYLVLDYKKRSPVTQAPLEHIEITLLGPDSK